MSVMGIVGSFMKWLFGGGDEDKPDSVTGLTSRQKALIVSSWHLVDRKRRENGVAFFLLLFKTYPKLKDYFSHFDGLSDKELEADPTLRAHGVTVMHSIGSLVENLEDTECLVKLAQKIARNHLHRNIRLTAFEELREMFPSFLEQRLGSSATADTKQAWLHLLAVLNSVVRAVAAEMGYEEKGTVNSEVKKSNE